MKLVFPAAEHAPVELDEGATTIGSDAACRIVLASPAGGIAPRHCEITLEAGAASVRPLDATAPTVLNGRQIGGITPIKDGDLLVFGRVGCSIVGDARKPMPAAPVMPVVKDAPSDDDGRTRVRAALPRFMLRGVSGTTFGKTFAVTDNAVIGRQPDCGIAVPAEEISRQHARLKITTEGVYVEDMGSANGTFINGKRVQAGLLKPGEELRLDTVRFLLVTPGMDARQQSATARAEPEAIGPEKGGVSLVWIVVGIIALALIALAALRYSGVF